MKLCLITSVQECEQIQTLITHCKNKKRMKTDWLLLGTNRWANKDEHNYYFEAGGGSVITLGLQTTTFFILLNRISSHLNNSCFFLLASLLTSTMYHLLSLYLGNNTNSKYLLTSVILIECNSWSYNLSRFYQSNQVDFNLILYFFSLRVVIANKGKDVTAA